MGLNGYSPEHDDEDDDEDDCIFPEKHADLTYREFVRTMNRLLEEGYSPFAVLVGLNRAAWEAAETLDDELHK